MRREKVEQLPQLIAQLLPVLMEQAPPQLKGLATLALSQIRGSLQVSYSIETHAQIERLVLWLTDGSEFRQSNSTPGPTCVSRGPDGERKELPGEASPVGVS